MDSEQMAVSPWKNIVYYVDTAMLTNEAVLSLLMGAALRLFSCCSLLT